MTAAREIIALKLWSVLSARRAMRLNSGFLLPVQQRRRLGDVGFVGGGAPDRVHQAGGGIHPDMGLHAEMPCMDAPIRARRF